jgi:hypothetical protein
LNIKILKTRLLRRQESFKESLQALLECLILLTEIFPKEYSNPGVVGTIFHNIVFCLKQLDYLEKGIEFGLFALKFSYEVFLFDLIFKGSIQRGSNSKFG